MADKKDPRASFSTGAKTGPGAAKAPATDAASSEHVVGALGPGDGMTDQDLADFADLLEQPEDLTRDISPRLRDILAADEEDVPELLGELTGRRSSDSGGGEPDSGSGSGAA